MRQIRARNRSVAVALAFVTAGLLAVPASAGEPDAEVVAYLDGKPIAIELVSKYYCDDFSYPVIQCSSAAIVTQARALVVELLTGVDYVTVFDLTSFNGGWMNISQDYPSLLTIGWNDRISSFKARNSETGRFFVDWLYTGTLWSFCCNQNVSSLGSFSNTFSSVVRT